MPTAPATLTPTRAELLALIRLAAPVVVVQLGLMAMGTVDTMMLGRLSPLALSAGALGNIYSLSFLVAAQGVLMALDPLVAQAHGAGERAEVSRYLGRGVVQALVFCLPLGLLMLDAEPLLHLVRQPAAICPTASDYVRWVSLANPAFLLFVVLRQTLQAMSVVRPAVLAILFANLVNVAANRVFIFGAFGIPAMGVAGAAIATAVARYALLLALLLAARRHLAQLRPAAAGRAGGWRARELFDWPAHRAMLRIGVPIGAQVVLEMWVFVTVALLAGSIGVQQLGAHQIAINLAALSFMVPLGIGGAGATMVGNAIGRGDPRGARRAATAALAVGVAVMAGFALCFAVGRHLLAALFTADAELAALAASLIAVAAVFQVFDGLQVVSLGVLRGAADTRLPAAVALVGYWFVGLPIGAYLGLVRGLGAPGLWWGLTAGLAAVGLSLLVRVRRRLGAEAPLAAIPIPAPPAGADG